MAQVETLAGMALGLNELDLDETVEAFREFLVGEGWEEPPDSYDWEGDYLRGTIVDYGDHGRWIFLEELESPRLKLAKKFAQSLSEPVRVYQVQVTERYSKGEANYSIDRRALEITPDGDLRDLDVHEDPGDDEGYGDLYETAGAVLGRMVHEEIHSPVAPAQMLAMYLPEVEDEDALDPRIRELADDLLQAGTYELVEMSGQQMLRFELPDGTRQMSRVTPEELETLVEVTGVSPS
jgi:hypothetical protein